MPQSSGMVGFEFRVYMSRHYGAPVVHVLEIWTPASSETGAYGLLPARSKMVLGIEEDVVKAFHDIPLHQNVALQPLA
ncbi:hypothetical protein CCMSSC00406_0007965 [Pleurotus cornucopiae]|uniref:Uncharacterized protein n=1 Tax=Pleurotus cornucopiae TaxID=5321 RepID=A0ACB7IL25_PLECO|nr:hypothetical protein CCMSSC00406_0007965 [Pleurotus cornucopiae]